MDNVYIFYLLSYIITLVHGIASHPVQVNIRGFICVCLYLGGDTRATCGVGVSDG